MKQKTSERFTDVMIELAKINAKLDAVLELATRVKVLEAYVDTQLHQKYYSGANDAYALLQGSLSESGSAQEWRQTLTNQDKLVDCISTISIPPTTEYIGGKKDA